ncbi:MAG: hypothetical protein M3295_08665 [Chloroflexota bacterium]|nr:hypothetical protein [Chloroflexota bacterium]
MRKFSSDDEPTYLGFLLKQLPRYVDSPELRARLDTARRMFREVRRGPWPPDEPLPPNAVTREHTARQLLNDLDYFHSRTTVPPVMRTIFEFDLREYIIGVAPVLAELRRVIQDVIADGHLRDEPISGD